MSQSLKGRIIGWIVGRLPSSLRYHLGNLLGDAGGELLEQSFSAYRAGYETAAEEIAAEHASYDCAKDRGLYPQNQNSRIEWDRGYEDACIAHRLGHDVGEMARLELYGPSLLSTAAVVRGLLDEPDERARARPDPRRAPRRSA